MRLASHLAEPVTAATLALLALADWSPVSATQVAPPSVLNPKEYVSPSGDYRLRVDPSERYGAGNATYRLTHKGAEVWAGERSFTLLNAHVGDDGTVAGYSYSRGRYGGDGRVIVLGPKGDTRLDQAIERGLRGLVFDPGNDRMIIRLAGPEEDPWSESWRVYRLSTARHDDTFE